MMSRAWLSCCLLLALTSCEREQRRFDVSPTAAAATVLAAGMPVDRRGYEETALAISQGRLLFSWYNCTGCHAHGGGNIGPPLMDEYWRYGAEPDQVFTSIVAGRPNGMPAFGQRLVAQQAWQLVAYVRAMGSRVPRDAAPGRDDGIQKGKPPQRRYPAIPGRQADSR